MGGRISKFEKKRFEEIRQQVDKAVIDKNDSPEFKSIVRKFEEALASPEPKIERYLVDYIKYLLKYKPLNARLKFNSILLLKELLKSGNLRFADYVTVKLLKRLYKIAKIESSSECLIGFAKEPDPSWSGHLQHLILETLGRMAELGQNKNSSFYQVAKRLKEQGRLPVVEKYWDFPSGGASEGHATEYQLAFERLETLFQLRKELKRLTLNNTRNLTDIKIKNVAEFYLQQKQITELDSSTKKILTVPMTSLSQKEREASEHLGRELFFCEDFQKYYNRLLAGGSRNWFIKNYLNLCRTFFEKEGEFDKSIFQSFLQNANEEEEDLPLHILEESKNPTPKSSKRTFFYKDDPKNGYNSRFLESLSLKDIEGDFKDKKIPNSKFQSSRQSMEFGDFSEDSIKKDYKQLLSSSKSVPKLNQGLNISSKKKPVPLETIFEQDTPPEIEVPNYPAPVFEDKIIMDLKRKNEESVTRIRSKLILLEEADKVKRLSNNNLPTNTNDQPISEKIKPQTNHQISKSLKKKSNTCSRYRPLMYHQSPKPRVPPSRYVATNSGDFFVSSMYKNMNRLLRQKKY